MIRRRVSILLAAVLVMGAPAHAADDERSLRRAINQGTVGLVASPAGDTDLAMAAEIPWVLDRDGLRVLVMAGTGPLQNIDDILYLRGIDLGLVQSDALRLAEREAAQKGVANRLHYVTHLYDEALHLVAGDGIASVEDLAGRQVAVGPAAGKSAITARIVFETLGVPIIASPLAGGHALAAVESGEVAAMLAVTDPSAPFFQGLGARNGVKLLALPLTDDLRRTYRAATLSGADHPGLIAEGEQVETLAVSTVLAVYNWKPNTTRYGKVVRFVESFLTNLPAFREETRHAKWRQVKPGAMVPGWVRFKPAEDWVVLETAAASGDIKAAFESFVASQAPTIANRLDSEREKEELFRLFLLWQASQRE